MEPVRVTVSEFQQSFGAFSDNARHEPVVITKHPRDSLVGLADELPAERVGAVREAKVPDEFAHLDAELK